jgi:DNA-binding MarR family transcriptional regulator
MPDTVADPTIAATVEPIADPIPGPDVLGTPSFATDTTPGFYDGHRYDATDSVGFRLFRVLTAMRREIDVGMARHGLTDAQWRPLWLLKIGRARSPQELARELDIDAGAVTRMLDRLESKGLLARVRSQTDRRMVMLALTEQGEAAVQAVPHVLAEVNNQFLQGFSKDEWQLLCALLGRMADNAGALSTTRGGLA